MTCCFICKAKLYGERTRVCTSVAPHSSTLYPEIIANMLGEEYVVIVTPADQMCKKCCSLINHMDKCENDARLIRNALLLNIHKQYGFVGPDKAVKNVEVVNGHLITKERKKQSLRKVPGSLPIGVTHTATTNSVIDLIPTPLRLSKARKKPQKLLRRQQEEITKNVVKIFKCSFCTYQSRVLGHVRFHMQVHAKRIEAEKPSIEKPSIENPSIEKPSIEKPSVEKPSIENPSIEKPSVEKPSIENPSIEKPSVEKPSVEKPSIENPSIEKPSIEKPSVEKPSVEKPSIENPSIEKPSIENPSVEKPSIENPSIEKPSVEKPSVEKPSIENPSIEKPSIENPSVEKPSIENPSIEKPSVENPSVEKPPIEKPSVENPSIEKPSVENPSIKKPSIEKPSVEKPVVEKPIVDQAAATTPVPQLKKRLFRCQVCSQTFGNRINCLDHIQEDHFRANQSTSNRARETENSHPVATQGMIPEPSNIQENNQLAETPMDMNENQKYKDSGTVDTDMMLNDYPNIPNVPNVPTKGHGEVQEENKTENAGDEVKTENSQEDVNFKKEPEPAQKEETEAMPE